MKREDFKKFAEKLRGFGLRVYLNKETRGGSNYAIYTDGKNIARMSESPWGTVVQIGTVHKPCRPYGTGFGLQNDYNGLTLEQLTKERALEGFQVAPRGWTDVDWSQVRKYRDFEDWKANCHSADLYQLD